MTAMLTVALVHLAAIWTCMAVEAGKTYQPPWHTCRCATGNPPALLKLSVSLCCSSAVLKLLPNKRINGRQTIFAALQSRVFESLFTWFMHMEVTNSWAFLLI